MLEKTVTSRGTKIDIEKCVESVDNRFDLVLIASARAREIRKQQAHSEKREHVFPIVTALEDVQSGKATREYLKRVR